MKKLLLYNQLARPFTLLPPLLGIVSGAVCAFGSVHNPDPDRRLTVSVLLTVALGSLCASFLNAASNALNQITDLDIDRVNKPKRPLVTGALSIREAWRFTLLTYVLAIVPTWWVVVYPHVTWGDKLRAPLGDHQTFFIYLLGLLFTLVYSMPEFGRSKARGMLANLTIAIPRGCLLKVAGWAMVARVGYTEPWFIGAIFGLFLIGASTARARPPGSSPRSSSSRGSSCRWAPTCAIRRTRRTPS
jgi:4-hydroxybenzoate polyprenyltransferase